MTITESERMALCDILLDYIHRDGHVEEFHDVVRGVTVTTEELLTRMVHGNGETDFRTLASAMRKVLPTPLLAEVIAHLDPLTPFVEFLKENHS